MKTTTEMPDTHIADSYTHSHNVESAHESGGSFFGHLWASLAATVILGIICCGLYPLLIWAIAQAVFPWQANGSLVKADGSHVVSDKDIADAHGSYLLGQAFLLPGYFHLRPSAANNSPGTTAGGYSVTAGYDPTSSGGTNFGPLSDELINGANVSPTPPATQPSEFLAYDGIRLRTIHYAVDNNISFKLFHATYAKNDDGTYTLNRQDEVPLKNYQDAQGNLNDIKLVDDFPHPTADSEYARTVLIAGDFAVPIPGDAVTASGSGLDPHISLENAKLQEGRVAAARNIKPVVVDAMIQEHTDQPSLGFLGDPGVNVLMLNIALDAKYPLPAPPATQPTTQPTTQP